MSRWEQVSGGESPPEWPSDEEFSTLEDYKFSPFAEKGSDQTRAGSGAVCLHHIQRALGAAEGLLRIVTRCALQNVLSGCPLGR